MNGRFTARYLHGTESAKFDEPTTSPSSEPKQSEELSAKAIGSEYQFVDWEYGKLCRL
jgi:hypothetical protein